jgi:hypothetical protein
VNLKINEVVKGIPSVISKRGISQRRGHQSKHYSDTKTDRCLHAADDDDDDEFIPPGAKHLKGTALFTSQSIPAFRRG